MRRAARVVLWSVVLLAAGLAALVWTGLREAVSDPIRRETAITLPGMPDGAVPYRIALLSDIHIGNRAMQPERLERIVGQINAARPDLVVIVGDFVNGHAGKLDSDPRQLTGPLSRLRARDGVVATLGNHEYWTDPDAVRRALEAAGVQVLANQPLQRGPVMLLGLDDRYTHRADIPATLAQVPQASNLPLVAINHSPDLAPQLPAGVTLLLAGHTHCGQAVLPGIGALAPLFGKLVGDRHYYLARYECGIVREGPRTTIVTGGLGSGSIPMRIGAPPDWWLVSLTAPRASPPGPHPLP